MTAGKPGFVLPTILGRQIIQLCGKEEEAAKGSKPAWVVLFIGELAFLRITHLYFWLA
jgi:hypothetical protein